MIVGCPNCGSNRATGSIIEEDVENPHYSVWHLVCDACGTEWVE